MPRYLRDGALDPSEKTSAERKSLTEPSSRPRNGAPRFIPPEHSSLPRKGWEQDPLIAECYRKSVDLLHRNSSPHGILASAGSPKAKSRNYLSVFGRDASICALGMVGSGDRRLVGIARAGYLSFVSYLSWGKEIDLYGNALSILFDLPEGALRRKIVGFLREAGRNGSNNIPITLNPIRKGSRHWREYMERHNLNVPHQYHNGGVWPYAGCFRVMAFAREKKRVLAIRELRNIAALNAANDWQFNEWFHGTTGRPMGMPGQSWNAAMFLLAYHSLRDGLTV